MVAPAITKLVEVTQSTAQASAFLDVVPPPARGTDFLVDFQGQPIGPALVKLTPWRHHLLLGYGSPFVTTAPLTRATLIQSLYLCSAAYRHESRLAFLLFRVRWWYLSSRRGAVLAEALKAWLTAAFLAMPPQPVATSKDGAGRPTADVHWLAEWVRVGRKLFQLTEAEVLHTPYIRLWQYLDLESADDPTRPSFDRQKTKQAGKYLRLKKQQTRPPV